MARVLKLDGRAELVDAGAVDALVGEQRLARAEEALAGAPAGDIVFLAVLYAGAVDVVRHYGDALAGKILVDLTNPFNADASGVMTTPGNSVAQQIAAIAPEGA